MTSISFSPGAAFSKAAQVSPRPSPCRNTFERSETGSSAHQTFLSRHKSDCVSAGTSPKSRPNHGLCQQSRMQ